MIDMNNLEIGVMNMIVDSSSARSYAMEAMYKAKAGEFMAAAIALDKCEAELEKAQDQHTRLIQMESSGEDVPLNLFFVHAQDHLMNASMVHDLANEIIDLYKRMESELD